MEGTPARTNLAQVWIIPVWRLPVVSRITSEGGGAGATTGPSARLRLSAGVATSTRAPPWAAKGTITGSLPQPRNLTVDDADRSSEGAGLMADPAPAGEQDAEQDDDHDQIDAEQDKQRDTHAAMLALPAGVRITR